MADFSCRRAARWSDYRLVMLGLVLAYAPSMRANAQVLDDPLAGSTSGIREGGTFVAGGWKVTGKNDCIYWHIPTITKGAYEYDVRGLNPNECRAGMEDKAELSHMYDYTWGNSDTVYSGGYRENPYKHFVRKTGCAGSYNNTIDSCELLWAVTPNYVEPDTPVLSWNPATTYRIRVEWGPDGSGNAVMKWFRDGVLYLTTSVPGAYAPAGHSFRIAASPRRDSTAGAPIDAVFSNVKVYDLIPPPSAPIISAPADNQTINTLSACIQWSGSMHTRYQVRVNTQNNPDAGVIWDSLDTASDRDFCFTGNLIDGQTCYAFVRTASQSGYSLWSSPGRRFTVNTAYVPPGANVVQLAGTALTDNQGPFLGLGVTYMSALYWARYDRNLLNSDLAFLASKEFNYIRILSQVPGGCGDYWDNRGIHPVSYTSRGGCFMPAWTDYTEQLRYLLDTVYNVHGMRTEITIFGGAGEGMPAKATRIEHLDRVLNAIAGREHEVLMLEVANEGWQTGFEGEQGRADMREFAQYLAARTSIPVAITSPQDTGNVGIIQLYGGSAADIATVHFSRDLGPATGWEPVYDCYRTGLTGIPPMSSNEPIGPGSSVNSESDPIKLVMAAAFAWGANLPMYVFHTSAGVRRDVTFQSMAGAGDYVHLNDLLPPDFAAWVRNDGKETTAPFTTYCNGQANKWWPEVSNPANGVVRHIGASKADEFITLPIGILAGGVELEARRPMFLQVYNPLTGQVVYDLVKNAGERFTLAQGPRAYIIKGRFWDVETMCGAKTQTSIDLGAPDVPECMVRVNCADGETAPVSVGGRSCRQNLNPSDDFYFYFAVDDGFAFQAGRPDLWITFDYFDYGAGDITLQYDSATGDNIDAFYKVGGSVVLTGSNTWKHAKFHLTDAYFGNRQNDGADFRFGKVGGSLYIDKVWVASQEPLPPVIAEVTPDPRLAVAGAPYTEQLTLTQGALPVDWSVVQGPTGLQVSETGMVSGWTPGAADLAAGAIIIVIRSDNPEGYDIESWEVQVISRRDFDVDGDVDLDDFGLFQRCLSGQGIEFTQGCVFADLSLDGDVDRDDLTLFVPCLGGTGAAPGC